MGSLGDSDIRERMLMGGSGTDDRHYSLKASFNKKILSRCRAYEELPNLTFLWRDLAFAKTVTSKYRNASRHIVAPDVAAASTITSESFWRREQDYTADMVRQMAHQERVDEPGSLLYDYMHPVLMLMPACLLSRAFPNLSITVSPTEWKFPMHASFQDDLPGDAPMPIGLHPCTCTALSATRSLA